MNKPTSETKQWLGGALLLLLLAILMPCLMGWQMEHTSNRLAQEMKSPLVGMTSDPDLKLQAAQRKKLETLETSYRRKVQSLCMQHCAARMKISEALKSGHPDAETLALLGADAGKAYSNLEEETLRHMMKICEVLDPTQKAIYLKKSGDHLAATCPREFMK